MEIKFDTKAPYDFLGGALIPFDKPLDWTSFDVVNKIRYQLKHLLGVKKIKVGHTGTLDPRATGLLMLATGKMTKNINQLTDLDKTYSGTMILGSTTASFDSEQPINETFPIDHITEELLEEKRHQFIGEISQQVPVFSAVKKNGKRLYLYARSNEEVIPPTKQVTVHEFKVFNLNLEAKTLDFEVSCSKGTYIRSIANDFGKCLNSGAYLSSLKRDSIGPWHVDSAYTIEDFIESLEQLNGTK